MLSITWYSLRLSHVFWIIGSCGGGGGGGEGIGRRERLHATASVFAEEIPRTSFRATLLSSSFYPLRFVCFLTRYHERRHMAIEKKTASIAFVRSEHM